MSNQLTKHAVLLGPSLLLFALLLTLPDLLMIGGTDYGVYFNSGRLLAQGEVPYRDFWDHKTPGIYVYLALWQLLFGSGWVSAKLSLAPIYALWGGTLSAYSYVLLRQRWVAYLTGFVGIFWVLRLSFDPKRNGAIVVLASTFEIAAVLLLWLAIHDERRMRLYSVLAGLLGVLAPLVRQTSVLFFVILGIISVWWLFTKKWTLLRMVLFPTVVGAALPTLIVLLSIVLSGLPFDTFTRPLIEYNRSYASAVYNDLTLLAWRDFFLNNLRFWGVALLSAGYLYWRVPRARYTLLCAFCALPLTLLPIRFSVYYSIQYIGYFIVIILLTFGIGVDWLWKRIGRLTPLLVLLLLSIILFQVTRRELASWQNWYKTARIYQFDPANLPDQQISRYISDQQPETLFVHGNRAWLYILTNLESPTPYYYSSPLNNITYLSRQEFDLAMAQLRTAMPPVIVFWWNVTTVPNPQVNEAYITEIEKFVEANYTPVKQFEFENRWPYSYSRPVMLYQLKR